MIFIAKAKYSILLVISIVIIGGLGALFRGLFSGSWVIGVLIGVIISITLFFHERIFEAIKNRTAKQKQKTSQFLTCPRCKILVEKDPGICHQCNQKL